MRIRDLLFAAVMAFCATAQAAPAPATAQHALSSDSADANQPVWENFNLDGSLSNRNAAFVLSGTVRVKNSKGGSIPILSGAAALTSVPDKGEVAFEDGRYTLKFKKSGTYQVHIQFNAKVTVQDGWNCINFDTVPASLRPVTLKGLPADTQFQFAGAARPERRGDIFTCFLPVSGGVQLRWKEARTEELGKLFFSAEGAVSVEVSPGLLRQTHAFDIKVMQGELSQIVFDLAGEGEVSRVTADNLLGWKIEPGPDNTRRLIAQFNQARKDECWVMIQAQTPLGAFPSRIQPLRVTPEGAIRYGGHLLIANNGAVRLEVTETKGLSQISPELFPRIEGAGETVAAQRTQSFAYRFSGADFGLAIQADNILPELAVSQMLIYTLAETETSIDAEIELEIREAPLREFTLEIPSDYTVSRLNAAQLSDHTVSPADKPGRARLKMLFAAPLTGRLVAQLRLEKNQNLAPGAWPLPEMTPQNVKSARGYVGVAADTGLRATASQTSGLTEIAGAFFPRKVAGLQYSARIKDDQWSATVNVERLALSVQADATHLFTVNQGIAYGSSILHYMISGAPVSSLRVAIPEEYGNVEFSGRDVRNWKKTSDGYEVFLQTPAFGAYTLLAAYDRQFNAQSNTVSFAGATPLDARSEQGTVLVASQQQLQVKPVTVSPGLIALEPAEIPAEHRLLFDAPLLAAYQYAARPFTLQLALQSLAVGETVRQAVDRAVAETRISREGETVTTARYYVKSQGHSHLQLTLPEGVQLWETTVNGQKVAPASDKGATLIPLPARADPSALLTVEVKLASKSADKKLVRLSLPAIDASVLLTQWTLNPDEKYRLEYRNGSFAPPVADVESGFDILRLYIQDKWIALSAWFGVLIAVLAAGSILARRAARPSVYRWSRTYWLALIPGMLCFASVIGVLGVVIANEGWNPAVTPESVALSAPIQASGSFLTATVANFEAAKAPTMMWKAWPALLGLAAWAWAWIGAQGFSRAAGILAGWLFVAWGALSLPDGLPFFLGTLMAFILAQIVVPSARILWNAPRRPKTDPTPPPAANPATAMILLGILGGFSLNAAPSAAPMATNIAQIEQKARATNSFVFVSATMTWKAEAGQRIAFLRAPGVLTRVDLPPAVKLDPSKEDPTAYWITSSSTGSYRIGFDYEVPISTANGFALPTPCGAVNRLDLTVEKARADASKFPVGGADRRGSSLR